MKTFFDLREAWETQKGIETKRKANTDVEEAAGKFTDKQIKMAYGIINDPRWKSGNMTSIVRRIEGIAKGLSKHAGVQKALKVTNEAVEAVAEAKEHPAYQQMMDLAKKINDRDTRAIQVLAGKISNFTSTGNRGMMKDMAKALKSLDTKNQAAVIKILNKTDPSLAKSINFKMAGMKEEVELDEAAPKISTGKAKGSIKATGLRGKGMKKFDVDVSVKNGKFEFRISDESGRFQTVGLKQAARMLGESVEDLEAFALNEANLSKVSTDKLKKIIKQAEDERVSPAFAMQVRAARAELKKRGVSMKEDADLEEVKKYTPPTKAEIEADKKKDRKADRAAGKARPSVTAKSITKRLYGR